MTLSITAPSRRAPAIPSAATHATTKDHRPTYGGPCPVCDAMAAAGVPPATFAGAVQRPDGFTERHHVPDPSLNDMFFPGSRSAGFLPL